MPSKNSPARVLAVDIGNSTTKVGLFLESRLELVDTFPTGRDDAAALEQALTPAVGNQIQGIIVSSVVPAIQEKLESLLQQSLQPGKLLWLDRKKLHTLQLKDIVIADYAADQLGTDRLANIVGAAKSFPEKLVLVCAFGTTATFDLVDETGRYLGGAICPGPRHFQSLVSSKYAAQLFEVDVFTVPQQTPGLSTEACLRNGLHYGYKGMILEVVGNLLQRAGWPLSKVQIILAGGDAAAIREMVIAEMPLLHVDSSITLNGLYHIWQMNAPLKPLEPLSTG